MIRRSVVLVAMVTIAAGSRSDAWRGRPATGVDAVIDEHARDMVERGRQIFRFDTFGDEDFWGNALRLHEAIAGERLGGVGPGVSPRIALAVGLEVDADALPQRLIAALKHERLDLDDPGVTVALLRLNAVLGVTGFFDGAGRLQSSSARSATRPWTTRSLRGSVVPVVLLVHVGQHLGIDQQLVEVLHALRADLGIEGDRHPRDRAGLLGLLGALKGPELDAVQDGGARVLGFTTAASSLHSPGRYAGPRVVGYPDAVDAEALPAPSTDGTLASRRGAGGNPVTSRISFSLRVSRATSAAARASSCLRWAVRSRLASS